jgi:integrase
MGSIARKRELDGVRPASESSIEIDFYYKGVRCRERIRLKPTPPNIKHCAKLKARIEHEISTGQFDYAAHFPNSTRAKTFSKKLPGNSLTIGAYLDKWLAVEKQSIRPSTLWGYEKILKHSLRPAFGDLPLSELKRKHLWDWIATHQNMSAKRPRNILSVLRIALNDFVEQEMIESNPLIGFKARDKCGSGQRAPYEVDPFSAEERTAIPSALEGQNRNLIQFAFWTGLRTSELIALDWSDIDCRRGVVLITKALTVGMEEPEEGTKTDAGRREVKLLPSMMLMGGENSCG